MAAGAESGHHACGVHIELIVGGRLMAVEEAGTCAKCGVHPAGDGRVLCSDCRQLIERQLADYWQPGDSGDASAELP
jgi:hypothetical protein